MIDFAQSSITGVDTFKLDAGPNSKVETMVSATNPDPEKIWTTLDYFSGWWCNHLY